MLFEAVFEASCSVNSLAKNQNATMSWLASVVLPLLMCQEARDNAKGTLVSWSWLKSVSLEHFSMVHWLSSYTFRPPPTPHGSTLQSTIVCVSSFPSIQFCPKGKHVKYKLTSEVQMIWKEAGYSSGHKSCWRSKWKFILWNPQMTMLPFH